MKGNIKTIILMGSADLFTSMVNIILAGIRMERDTVSANS